MPGSGNGGVIPGYGLVSYWGHSPAIDFQEGLFICFI